MNPDRSETPEAERPMACDAESSPNHIPCHSSHPNSDAHCHAHGGFHSHGLTAFHASEHTHSGHAHVRPIVEILGGDVEEKGCPNFNLDILMILLAADT